MRQISRVKIIGSATAGSTGQPIILKIESIAFAAITSRRSLLGDGAEIVGHGISTDMEVQETVQAFRRRKDLVLERTVAVLLARLSN